MEQIEHFLSKGKNEPRDVLILVKEMQSYAPFIQAHFKNPELKIEPQILKRANQNSFISLFFKFLNLFEKGLEKKDLFEILFQKPLYSQLKINPDHLEQIEKRFKMTFGLSKEHRKEIFQQDGIENPELHSKFTFEDVKNIWLDALIEAKANLLDPVLDTLGKCIEIVEKWYLEFELVRIDAEKPISFWTEFLFHQLDYFKMDQDDEVEQFGREQLMKKLSQFSQYEYILSFSNFKYQLEKAMHSKLNHFYEGKNSLSFCPFEMDYVLPKKLIVLLGMHLDMQTNSHQAMQQRHTFLKAITYAKEKCVISFSQKNALQEENQLDLAVKELQLHYNLVSTVKKIEKMPSKDEKMQLSHSKNVPVLSFQQLLFVLTNPLKAYCQITQNFYLKKAEKATDLFLDPREKFKVLKEDLSDEKKIAYFDLPIGFLEKTALFDETKEREKIESSLKKWEIEKSSIFSHTFDQKDPIFGVVHNLSSKGALIFSKQKQIAHLKALCTLAALANKVNSKALLMDLDQVIEAQIDPKSIHSLIELANLFLKKPTPFSPEMIPSILKKEPITFRPKLDPYALYFPNLKLEKETIDKIYQTFEPFVEKGFFHS